MCSISSGSVIVARVRVDTDYAPLTGVQRPLLLVGRVGDLADEPPALDAVNDPGRH